MTCFGNKYAAQPLRSNQISFDLVRGLNIIGSMVQKGTLVETVGGGTAFETIWGPTAFTDNTFRCGLWDAGALEEFVVGRRLGGPPSSTVISVYSADDGSLQRTATIPAGTTIGNTSNVVEHGGLDASGNVYLYDNQKHAVLKYASDLSFTTQMALPAAYQRVTHLGVGIFAVNPVTEFFYIALRKISTNKLHLLKFDLFGSLITALDISTLSNFFATSGHAHGNQCFLSDGRLVIISTAGAITLYDAALSGDAPAAFFPDRDGANGLSFSKVLAVTSADEIVFGLATDSGVNNALVYNTAGGVLVSPKLDVELTGINLSPKTLFITADDDLILHYVNTNTSATRVQRFNKNTTDTTTITHTWTIPGTDGLTTTFVPMRKYASQHCAEPPSRIVPWETDADGVPIPQDGALSVPFPKNQITAPAYQAPTSVLIVRDLRSYIDQLAVSGVLTNKETGAALTRDWSTVNDLYYAAIGHSAALKEQVGGTKSYSWQRSLGYLASHAMNPKDLVELKLCADYLRDCALNMIPS